MQPDLSGILFRLTFVLVLLFSGLKAQGAAPTNDRCAFAIVIPTNGPFPYLTAEVDISEATTTNDPPAPSCQSFVSRSVWYSFRPATTDSYLFSTCGEMGTGTTIRDSVMAIYTAANGCGTTYTEIAN